MMKFKIKAAIVFLCISMLLVQACKKEKPQIKEIPKVVKGKVLVLNEGNFGWNNASIGIYDSEKKEYTDGVFKEKAGKELGDILQSVMADGSEIYLVVNNSGKIEVLDKNSLDYVRTLSVGGSPRYLAKIEGKDEAFLTDYSGNFVRRINLQTGEVIKVIAQQGFTERIQHLGNGFFAFENMNSKKVYLLNAENNQITDSFAVEGRMAGFSVDKDNKTAYLDGGSANTTGKLLRLNAADFSMPELIFSLPEGNAVSKIDYKENGSWVFVQGNQLVFMSENGNIQKQVTLPQGNYYGFEFISGLKEIYLSDAKDYTQNSLVLVFNNEGEKKYDFTAGRITSGFYYLDK
jgi:DNA-binding beta-propeller fold protein YncE